MVALTAYSWRRHSVTGLLPFTYTLLLGILWKAGSTMLLIGIDLS